MTGADLLRAARPAAWNAVAAAWRHLAESLAGRADRIRGLTCRLRGSWSGAAADAAGASLDRYAADLDRAALVCLAVDQVLCDFAARLAVDRPHADDPAARADADRADADAARRLADSVPDLAAPAVAVPPWPAAAGDPAAVRRWWNALTGPQRLALLSADPRRLGGLDGIPVEVRDRANRLLLTGLAARAGFDADTGVDVRAGLNALRARLDRDQPARAYLLNLDPSGDGRAVVAIGDPDRAANIVTYVPGTGSDLAGIGAGCLLPAADRLAARAGASTSVVLWLGYDAPDNPAVAGSEQYAVGAGAALDAFQDGLRDTHEGAPAHRTVLGHSYGSTVVGYTARDRGLATDDTVFVGSPGVGVDHARDLRLDPAHVWSSTAAADPIRLTAVANALPDVLGRGDPHELWFGTDPSSAGFGGRVFDSPPGSLLHPVRTHVGYLDADNPALAEVAAIATRP